MKTSRLLSILACLALGQTSSSAVVVAFWDFNDGFSEADEVPQIVHGATQGSGTLYQQRADTDGNGKGGTSFVDAINAINASDGKSMAWDDVGKGGDNDAEVFVVFSTTGLQNIRFRFDLEGNPDDGITSYDVKYALSPLVDVVNPPDVTGTIKDFDGGTSVSLLNNNLVPAGTNAGFVEVALDFSGETALNNQSTVVIRFDDFKENDGMKIDNVLITADAIPEPSSTALVALGALGLAARRRR